MKASIPIFAAVLVAAASVAFYAGRRTSAPPPAPAEAHAEEHASSGELTLSPDVQRRFGIRFAAAVARPMGQTIQATGSVQANGSRVAHIRALARGRIDDVYVRLGDRVRAGQRLLTYDNVELGEAIGEYLAAVVDLRKSTAEAEVSRGAVDRARNLAELGALARAEFQRREAEHKNALATIESRRAAAANVEEKLHRFGMTHAEIEKLDPGKGLEYHRERSHSTVTAPFAGVITQFSAAPGETVGTDSELMTVADLSTVWVLADVYEKDIASIREGQSAGITVAAYPDRVFTGKITYISDVLDPSTRTAKVRVEVPNSGNLLKLEMFATVRIPTAETRSVLAVPSAAVQNLDGATVVFVKEGGNRFEKRPVTLGAASGDWVEVTSGLSEGDEVAAEGSFLLKSELKKSELGEHED